LRQAAFAATAGFDALAGLAECASASVSICRRYFIFLLLQASANSIRRQITSERVGLSFCCLAQLSLSDTIFTLASSNYIAKFPGNRENNREFSTITLRL